MGHDRDNSGIGALLWRMTGKWYFMLIVLALLYANNRLYFVEDPTGNWPAGAPVGSMGQPLTPDAWAVWRNGVVVCVDPALVLETDRPITYISYSYRDRSGTLDATGTVMESVGAYTVGGAPADPKAVEAAYLAWLAKHPDKYWQKPSARLAKKSGVTTAIRWRAFLRLVGNFLLLAFLIRSLAWTIPIFDAIGRGLSGATMTPAERAAARRKLALARGECPACAYDIRGLPHVVCPECAHRWTEAEARTVPRHK